MTWAKADLSLIARPDLSASAKLVFIMLTDRQGQNGTAWPSIRRIATDCGIGSVTAQRAIKALVTAKLLTITSAGPNGGRKTNHYTVCVSETNTPKPAPCTGNEHTTEKPVCPKRTRCVSETDTVCVSKTDNESDQVNQTKGTRPRARAASKLSAIELPETLDMDAFRTAWAEWETFKREARKKLTPSTIKKQLTQLETYGHDDAIASIQQSIRNGWAGLFEPRGDAVRGNGQTQRRPGRPYAASGHHQGIIANELR